MRHYLLAFFACSSLFATPDFDISASEEENFFLRRIASFWQEGEYGIAKKQMEEFLATYPQSPFSDLLHLCLGDLLLGEKNFSEAIATYSAISSPDLLKKIFLNRMQCLYHLEWYSILADECEEFLLQETDAGLREKTIFYLAVALYHQCLNANNEPQTLLNLAKRAEPYFEILLETNFSSEISHAFAHLCCILKDHKKAADIYLALAAKEPELEEEMLFQAALMQAKYDQTEALRSLKNIVNKGQKNTKEAAYNYMILNFEAGRYDELVHERESLLASLPEEKQTIAHYFFGKSFLHLKKYREAKDELRFFLDAEPLQKNEWTCSALLSLMEASHEITDIETLEMALENLSMINASDELIARGKFLRVRALKKRGNEEKTRIELEELLGKYPDFFEQASACFELADLEYQIGNWKECRLRCQHFLKQFPSHELAPFAWRYLAASSSHLADQSLENKREFAQDLETLLQERSLFPEEEVYDWQVQLGHAYFNLELFEKAISLFEPILNSDISFTQKGNAYLILALCHRESRKDLLSFCRCAESAIENHATLMQKGQLHVALFNAYLELSKNLPEMVEKTASHLYEAFLVQADVSKENLLWLGNWFFSTNPTRAAEIFSFLLQSDFDETTCYRLAQLYSQMGRTEELAQLLETLLNIYHADPQCHWNWEKESKLLLAETYQSIGAQERALELFGEVAVGPIRSNAIAKAYLEKARLQKTQNELNETQIAQIVPLLKSLILQRRLEFEPIHLEAALEYVDILEKTASNPLEKRILLLENIKSEFENTNDIISSDYHALRKKHPDKNLIYEDYMKFLNQEIFTAKSALINETDAQKELQAKAKGLLLQIKCESTHPWLAKRVASRLQKSDVPVFE